RFRVKGDTVDIYPSFADFCYRVSFWDDEVEIFVRPYCRLHIEGTGRRVHPFLIEETGDYFGAGRRVVHIHVAAAVVPCSFDDGVDGGTEIGDERVGNHFDVYAGVADSGGVHIASLPQVEIV
ncbi:MAG: hypothetical protein II424_02130, partial [Bacteroidales bacterium]|nr:hypothetical protein [Bacteroidales bacterium]